MGNVSAVQDPIHLQLVALLLHDLETPLTLARQLLRRMEEGRHDPAKPKHREFQRATYLAVQRAERILEDLLDYARHGGGQIPFRPVPTHLRELVEECITVVRPLADDQGHTLEVQLEPPEPGSCHVDDRLLSRVMDNLLVNAVLNAPRQSRIELRATLKSSRFRVEVLNPAEENADFDFAGIFDPAVQIDLRSRRHLRGIGLGLTFSRMAVEAQGGTIGAGRTENGDVFFRFEIPVN